MHKFSFLLAAFAMTVASAAADAAGSHDHVHGPGYGFGEPGKAAEVTRTIEVLMNDKMRFEPASVRVGHGETIRFLVKNVGAMPHEFMLGTAKDIKEHHAVMLKHPEMEHEEEPNAVSLEPGKTGEVIWKFSRSGAFEFACLKPGHLEAGMAGRVQVGARPGQPTADR